MTRILLSLVLGAAAGIVDIIPMFLQKLDKYSITSAFIQWILLGFVITFIDFGVDGWLKGLIMAVLLSLPVLILVIKSDPKSALPILVMSAVLGSVVGAVSKLIPMK